MIEQRLGRFSFTLTFSNLQDCLFKLQEAASEYLQFLDLGCVTIRVLQNN